MGIAVTKGEVPMALKALVADSLGYLGYRATDRISGFKGTITSVLFYLNGSVQVHLCPPMDKHGKVEDGYIIDISRAKKHGTPVMKATRFADESIVAAGIDLLGYEYSQIMTGFIGNATIVSFDLYGCIEVGLQPPVDKDGKNQDARWIHSSFVKRTTASAKRKISPVDFLENDTPAKHYDRGSSPKPAPRSS